jgi:hypothetical protein
MSTPTAFISYTWESDEHKTWVRQFATRLRSDGIDVRLDQWELAPGDQLPSFMEQAVRDNQFVLVVCTPTYKHKSDSRQGGVGYEGDVMTAEVFSFGTPRKFIPILRQGSWSGAAPSWMLGKLYLDLKGDPYNEQNYSELVRTLHSKREQIPPLGAPPVFESESSLVTTQKGLRLHLLESEIEALYYSPDKAIIRFTISNLTGELIKLTRLHLSVLEKKRIETVRLPKVGAPLAEFGFDVDLSDGPQIDLLANTGTQFVLKPEESDAFAINTIGEQGYRYNLMLSGKGEAISEKWIGAFESIAFSATYPIRTPRALKSHGTT